MYSAHHTTGSYNTVIGYQSLFNNIMGDYNIAIGESACVLTTSLGTNTATSSYNSIFIGSNTKPQLSNQTNQIVIGHGATGNGSNSVTLGNNDIIKTILKGNIGIGTESPSTKLHVYSTQSGAFRLEDGTQGPGKILISNANGVASWTSSVSVSIFYNLGGTVSATNSTSAIYRTGSLNIGTGSVSTYTYGPLSVPVDGRFTVSSSTGTVSLVVDESGNIFNDSINGNTKFGFQALNSATSSLIPFGGQGCVAIGTRALYSCTSGILNTAVGYGALYYNTTASGNVSVGALSLHNNTTGYNNVAVGNNALIFNTTGYLNTAIGNYALGKNTTGYYNISLGVQSGTIISGTGDINTGTGAANSNSSIFIGYFTCPSAASNTNEIVIGHGATGNGSNTVTLGNNFVTRTYLKGSVVIADGTQGNGYILTSDANGVATWTTSIYATDSNVVHKTGNENIDGIKTFTGSATTKIILDTGNGQGIFGGVGALSSGTNFYSQNQGTGIGAYFDTSSTGRAVWIASGASSSGRVLDITAGGSGDAVSIASSGSARLIVGMSGSNVNFTLNKVGEIYTAGSINIGTGTASNSRFVVSSSGGTTSFHVNEAGDSVFRGDTKIIGATFSPTVPLPPGSITFGSKTAIYPPGDNEIVIGTDTLFRYGWKFTGYQITNLWGNTIEFQNIMGTIGNLFVGSTYQFAGYNVFSPSQRSTLFVKGTTASIMRVVGIGATWSNSQSIFEINNNGAVSIGTSLSMSGTELFIQSNTASTTIGSNVMLDLYNGQLTGTPGQVSELAFSADTSGGGVNAYNTQHRYAIISGYATTWNGIVTGGGIKFSTRATTSSSLVTSLVVDQNGSVYNEARGSSNTIYGYQALLNGTASLNNTAIGYQALLTTTASLYNTAIGYRSLYSNTTGDNNTALGYQSLYSNTTGFNNTTLGFQSLRNNTTGTNSVAIGYQALYNNTTGYDNVAIGYRALYFNEEDNFARPGRFNVAIGSSALYINESGKYNVAIGHQALYSNEVDNNVALGYQSLYTNYNGDNNTAVGSQALYSSYSGSQNTAIGRISLWSNTTGSGNTAVGHQALWSNTTGGQNVGLGAGALNVNTTGTYNTALGYGALQANISGSYNIAIGNQAGYFSTTGVLATSSNNSIFIGYDTKPQLSNQTNQVVIGHGATGNGSNSFTLGNDSITKTIVKGNVGIGLTGPSTKLHIYATQSGALRLADGTQGNGYILTSDTNGVASWTASFALGVIATSSNITTDTLDINGLSQRGRCIIIDNGTYSINLTVNGATGFSSTYLKHGTASVTFVQGSGRTLVQVDGTAVLNGVAGSTATLLSYGTTDYLRINNA